MHHAGLKNDLFLIKLASNSHFGLLGLEKVLSFTGNLWPLPFFL